MISFLLDTDVVIDFLKGKPETVERVRALAPDGIGISVISVAELYEGVFGSREEERHMAGLLDFLSGAHVLTVDDAVARVFGRLRAELRREGNLIDNFDLLIAATCLHYDLELHTGNVKHFRRIGDLRLATQS